MENTSEISKSLKTFKFVTLLLKTCCLITRFFYKEHVYKELEAENGPKNKELLRNCSG